MNSDAVRVTSSDYGQTAALRRCRRCRFVFAETLPAENLVELYSSMDDPAYRDTSGPRRVQMRRLLETILEYHPSASSLLDVGSGMGLMVREAIEHNLSAEGIEPSLWCVQTAMQQENVRLHAGTLTDCAERLGKYDVVCLIDVVEHVSDPMGLMRQAAERLNPGGLLVVVTPDIDSPTAHLMGRYWWHHRIAHVCYFNRFSTHYALRSVGLELVADQPAQWCFPLGYLTRRLSHYIPLPPISTILNAISRSEKLAKREIMLDLRDSRIFVARAGV